MKMFERVHVLLFHYRKDCIFVGFRATYADADYGYAEYNIVVQHRKSRISATHLFYLQCC